MELSIIDDRNSNKKLNRKKKKIKIKHQIKI